MKDVKVTTFNVGQGLFNLVTGTKDDGSPYCGVFDCGNFKVYTDLNCIEEAYQILKNYTIIDNVVISHQDVDHWRNLIDLILKFNDCIHDNNKWYKMSQDNKEAIVNFSQNYLNVCNMVNRKSETFLQHYCETYIKKNSIYFMASVYGKEDYHKSYWEISFEIIPEGEIEIKKYNAKITPSIENDGKYMISFLNKKTVETDIANIGTDFIALVYEFKIQNKTVITDLFKIIKVFLFYNIDKFNTLSGAAYPITKYIKRLFCGGLDCENPYNIFKRTALTFSYFFTSDYFFLRISPDFDLYDGMDILYPDQSIRNYRAEICKMKDQL